VGDNVKQGARLAALEARYGERFRPDAGWVAFGAGSV